ncbi:MAG: gamma-glutamyl-phosphate reductase, partial [Chloroflexi bacterium]|nr:gamma-glutamyl-phosphate reductase [Chloroflexota bacterium]
MKSSANEVDTKTRAAKDASKKLAYLNTAVKNKALLAIADALVAKEKDILAANRKDYSQGKKAGMSAAMLDRLLLNTERIKGIAADVRAVAALPDPVGEIFEMRTLSNGLQVGKKRVPLGVIGAIYESRPNVTVDISV